VQTGIFTALYKYRKLELSATAAPRRITARSALGRAIPPPPQPLHHADHSLETQLLALQRRTTQPPPSRASCAPCAAAQCTPPWRGAAWCRRDRRRRRRPGGRQRPTSPPKRQALPPPRSSGTTSTTSATSQTWTRPSCQVRLYTTHTRLISTPPLLPAVPMSHAPVRPYPKPPRPHLPLRGARLRVRRRREKAVQRPGPQGADRPAVHR
jgi:hypothetical protein